MFLTHILSSTTTVWHPSRDRSALVGAVGSSTPCQGTWEESHLPMHWLMAIQTLISAVDPEVACEPALAPLSHDLGVPGEQSWTVTPRWESLCGNPGFQRRSSNTLLERGKKKSKTPKTTNKQKSRKLNKNKNACIREGKRNSWILPIWPLFQGSTIQCQEKPSWPVMISSVGWSESVWVNTQPSQLCRMLPKRQTSLSLHPQYWVVSYTPWRAADRRVLKGHGSYWPHHRLQQEASHKPLGSLHPLIHKHTQYSVYLTPTHIHILWPASYVSSQQWWKQALVDGSWIFTKHQP